MKIPLLVTTTAFQRHVNELAEHAFGVRKLLNRTALMKSLLPIMLETGDAAMLPQGEDCRMVAILASAIESWVLYLVRRRKLIQAHAWSRIHKYSVADFEKLSTMTDEEFESMLPVRMKFD